MCPVSDRQVRRRVALLVLGVALASGCGAPGADVEQLSQEPILSPPMDGAVELGRVTADGDAGFIWPGVPAVVEVAYAVEMAPEDAQREWVEAYGDQYDLGLFGGLQVMGGSDTAGVSMAFEDSVVPLIDPEHDYRDPPPGWTVVTIIVGGYEDGDGPDGYTG